MARAVVALALDDRFARISTAPSPDGVGGQCDSEALRDATVCCRLPPLPMTRDRPLSRHLSFVSVSSADSGGRLDATPVHQRPSPFTVG